MTDAADAVLQRALAASWELLAAAEQSDMPAVERLDAERLRLLQSLPPERERLRAGHRLVLQQISELNDQAIGLVEHHRRRKGRALDLAAVGRRAVAAYSNTRQQR